MVDNKLMVVLVMFVLVLHSSENVRNNRRPKLYGDKIPFKALLPSRKKIQQKIVLFHNYFRTKVAPPAANMLRMKWHEGAATAAQRWAEECMFLTHDNTTGRSIRNYGACGQNIFVASHKVPWLFAVKTWFLERDNFTYGSDQNDLRIVGHYTQMVWAATHEVGCGFSRCYTNQNFATGVYYSYVCNYCPIGNRPGMVGEPYKRGRKCGLCGKHCHKKRLCTNACPFADMWVNCEELRAYGQAWLCNTRTPQGWERLLSCRATCRCRGRIHD